MSRSGAYTLTTVILGYWLIVAGLMKSPTTVPPNLASYAHSFAILETLLGCWLVSGKAPRLSRMIALLVFCCFCATNVYWLAIGVASCSCFGFLHVSPAVTLAADILAVLALVFLYSSNLASTTRLRFATGTIVIAFSLLVIKIAPWKEELPIANPSQWSGKVLPLLSEIDIRNQLEQGEWVVVFYREDCSACHEVVHNLENNRPDVRTAFINVIKGSNFLLGEPDLHGRLDPNSKWFVPAPVIVRLINGLVVSVDTDWR